MFRSWPSRFHGVPAEYTDCQKDLGLIVFSYICESGFEMTADKDDAREGSHAAGAGETPELPKRRDRLESLKARRESLATEAAPTPAPQAAPVPAGAAAMMGRGGFGQGKGRGMKQGGMMQRRGAFGAGMGGPGGLNKGGFGGANGFGGGQAAGGAGRREGMQAMQRKVAARIMRLLTQTPADERGYVPGTPFTQTGVGQLMKALDERSGTDGTPGAKAAGAVKKFLLASPDQSDSIEGASLEKLQMLARRIEGARGGAGGAGGF